MSKAEQTRQYIIEKTSLLFNMKGVAGTSLSDLTKATGLTKGSIYGNFQSKDDVAIAAFKYNLSLLVTAIQNEINAQQTALDKLLVYPAYYLKIYNITMQRGGCPILNTAVESDDTHPVLREKAIRAIHQWKNNLVNIINLGLEQGEFSEDIDPGRYADLIIALVEGGIMLSKATGDPCFILNAIDEVENKIRNEIVK